MNDQISIRRILSAYRRNVPNQLPKIAALIHVRANQIRDSLPLSAKRSHSQAYIKAMQIRNELMRIAVRLNEDNESWDQFWNTVETLESERIIHESR